MPYRPFAVLPIIALVFALVACAGNAPRPQPAADTVSVVTLNLYHDKADWPKRRIQIAETLGRLAPDAIVLQEVIQTATLPNQAEWLADQLGYAHHFVTVDPPGSSVRYGNALLTRHPVLRRDDVRLEPAADSRTAGLLRIDMRGQPLNIYATHLHHTAEGGAIRERQLADLMDFIARTAGDAPSWRRSGLASVTASACCIPMPAPTPPRSTARGSIRRGASTTCSSNTDASFR
jgi:beta-glucosidase